MLIQSSTSPRDVVLDCTAVTCMLIQCSISYLYVFVVSSREIKLILLSFFLIVGSSIHASRNVECHIVALEVDEAIFHAVLKPLIRSSVAPEVTFGSTTSSEDPKGNVRVVPRIVRKSQFSN